MITPLLLFFYLILATVVLVNLLIAQMSKTYEMIIDESRLIWQFDYVHSIVIEYKDNRDVLPAPLNIIDMLIIDPIKLLRYLPRARACEEPVDPGLPPRAERGDDDLYPRRRAAGGAPLCEAPRGREARAPSTASRTSSAASSSSRPTSATCSSSSPAASTS